MVIFGLCQACSKDGPIGISGMCRECEDTCGPPKPETRDPKWLLDRAQKKIENYLAGALGGDKPTHTM